MRGKWINSDISHIKEILHDLKWLGLDWDEGPEKDKGNGPYFQSLRYNIYEEYYKKLEELELAYPCFCSEEQLTRKRKAQLRAGKPPRYDGTCKKLTKEEIKTRLAQGEKAVIRFSGLIPNDAIFSAFIVIMTSVNKQIQRKF